jgi:hydrogenase-4 component F
MIHFDALIAALWIVPAVAILLMLAIRRPCWAEYMSAAIVWPRVP